MATQPSAEVRLLPLIENSPNEGVANTLARLLVEDVSQAHLGAHSAILILTGVQAFLDSGGDYTVVERLWEPIIVARQMEKSYGSAAWKKAAEMAAAATKVNDERGQAIYSRAATILCPEVNKGVANLPSPFAL
jgi:hypothetical protein